MTGTQVVFSLTGVVVGAILTATFNLLQDRRRRRAASLPVRRLVLDELVTGRDDLAFMIASRTWKRIRARFSKWEELENEFAGVVREKDRQLVRSAFGAFEIIDEFARKALTNHDTSANDTEKLLGTPLSSTEMHWIQAFRDVVVEKAVLALDGPPESGATKELAERTRQQQEDLQGAQEKMRRVAGEFIRLAAAEASAQSATSAASNEDLGTDQNSNATQGSRMRPAPPQFTLSDEEWTQVKFELRAAILEAAKARRTTWYGEAAAKVTTIYVDPDSDLMNHLLRAISEDDDAAGRPLLTAIVAHDDGCEMPGPAFREMTQTLGYRDIESHIYFWATQVILIFRLYGRSEPH